MTNRSDHGPPLALVEEACKGAVEALTAFYEGRIAAARVAWDRVGRARRYGPAVKARGVPRYITHDLGHGRGERTQTVSAWARELGWKSQALTYRLEHMPLHKVLTKRAKVAVLDGVVTLTLPPVPISEPSRPASALR